MQPVRNSHWLSQAEVRKPRTCIASQRRLQGPCLLAIGRVVQIDDTSMAVIFTSKTVFYPRYLSRVMLDYACSLLVTSCGVLPLRQY
jgi:hypothetical protein